MSHFNLVYLLLTSHWSFSSGGCLSPVRGYCGSEPGAHGDPSGKRKPDQTSQVHDPNGSVFGTLSSPLVDCHWVLRVRTQLQEHLGDNMDGGELQALSHTMPIQGRVRDVCVSETVPCNQLYCNCILRISCEFSSYQKNKHIC